MQEFSDEQQFEVINFYNFMGLYLDNRIFDENEKKKEAKREMETKQIEVRQQMTTVNETREFKDLHLKIAIYQEVCSVQCESLKAYI